jgi:1,4-alpha-glucan branching enzyme
LSLSRAASAVVATLEADLRRLADGRHHHPHGVLGPHRMGEDVVVVAYLPHAATATVEDSTPLERIADSSVFVATSRADALQPRYRIAWTDGAGQRWQQHDPYAFPLVLDGAELARLGAGAHHDLWRCLGAHVVGRDGVHGVRFAVWAPNAERVSVVGPFCLWDGRRFPMSNRGASGVWELFVPDIGAGELYKFEIRHRESGALFLKSDPCARAAERRPATASRVSPPSRHAWQDGAWLAHRASRGWLNAPMSIYEVHPGSWRRRTDGEFMSYRELADTLVPYVMDLGFTHIELLPITEHPLDDSWGYQTTGYFAPTSRYGDPDDLRALIDACHAAGLGVILDWVPGHFPRDAHGLANFDGTALYEHADPRRAEHKDWGTLIFDYERREVRSFLLSSACYWLEEFHFDGLRVDAVASMLYLDFGRKAGEFVPNREGGNHDLEAIGFLRELNRLVHARFPGAVVIAEESTEWPLVSRPIHDGGLGFSMKWNMGWMHDTLQYFSQDPLFRSHHHERLTFAMMYAYTENFVLPLSHDEVVHLKRSLLGRMPGDAWQRLASLRLLYTYQWTFPGKKLLFMGGEFGQETEWDFRTALPWETAGRPAHAGVRRALSDLNALYRDDPRLHAHEFDPSGFRWIDCDDRARSLLSYERRDGEAALVVILNFTPVPRHAYRVGVPHGGAWREVFNSDAPRYAGSGVTNDGPLAARRIPSMNRPWCLDVTLPPLGGIVLSPSGKD